MLRVDLQERGKDRSKNSFHLFSFYYVTKLSSPLCNLVPRLICEMSLGTRLRRLYVNNFKSNWKKVLTKAKFECDFCSTASEPL